MMSLDNTPILFEVACSISTLRVMRMRQPGSPVEMSWEVGEMGGHWEKPGTKTEG